MRTPNTTNLISEFRLTFFPVIYRGLGPHPSTPTTVILSLPGQRPMPPDNAALGAPFPAPKTPLDTHDCDSLFTGAATSATGKCSAGRDVPRAQDTTRHHSTASSGRRPIAPAQRCSLSLSLALKTRMPSPTYIVKEGWFSTALLLTSG